MTCKESNTRALPPMPAECCMDHGGPCECCFQLAKFDRQLSDLDARLGSSERRDILREINKRHDPFVLRLPSELASRIFELCIPKDETREEEHILSVYQGRFEWPGPVGEPQILAMVCHQWRQIAFSTPRLWTSIPILIFSDPEKINRQLNLLQRWSRWPGALPLSVSFRDGYNLYTSLLSEEDPNALPVVLQSTFDLVNKLLPRCKFVKISLPFEALPHVTGNGATLMHLQELEVRLKVLYSQADPDLTRIPGNLFSLGDGGQPHLKKVTLRCLPYQTVAVSWAKVVNLEILELDADDIITFLRQIPHLKRLEIQLIRNSLYSSGQPRVVHDCLQEIHTRLFPVQDTPPIWNLFTFPSLTDMIYQGGEDFEAIAPMLSRSRCRLKTFSLEIFKDYNEEVIACFFHSLPFLINLRIGSNLGTSRVVMKLLSQIREGPDNASPTFFLRELQQLTLQLFDYSVDGDWWSALLEFLESLSRNSAPARPLKTFHVILRERFEKLTPSPVQVMDYLPEVIARVIQKGVDVSIVDEKGVEFRDYYSNVDPPLGSETVN